MNGKRLIRSTKSYDKNNCAIGDEEDGQSCLVIYCKNAKVRRHDKLTFLYCHEKTIRKAFCNEGKRKAGSGGMKLKKK